MTSNNNNEEEPIDHEDYKKFSSSLEELVEKTIEKRKLELECANIIAEMYLTVRSASKKFQEKKKERDWVWLGCTFVEGVLLKAYDPLKGKYIRHVKVPHNLMEKDRDFKWSQTRDTWVSKRRFDLIHNEWEEEESDFPEEVKIEKPVLVKKEPDWFFLALNGVNDYRAFKEGDIFNGIRLPENHLEVIRKTPKAWMTPTGCASNKILPHIPNVSLCALRYDMANMKFDTVSKPVYDFLKRLDNK